MKKTAAFIVLIMALFLTSFVEDKAEEKEINFSLTLKEADVVLKHLSKGPFDEVNPIIQKLVFQAQAQLTDTTKNKQDVKNKGTKN